MLHGYIWEMPVLPIPAAVIQNESPEIVGMKHVHPLHRPLDLHIRIGKHEHRDIPAIYPEHLLRYASKPSNVAIDLAERIGQEGPPVDQ